ncbi:MAG TPA: hypothetical protein VHC19_05030 [Pirellulales bacterium]|nr:hypothetical protein [Pirellulales bacterium]
MRALPVALLVVLVHAVSIAEASHNHCQHCDSCQNCRKVCRLICGKKEVVKPVYSYDRDYFCIPERSEKCGEAWTCNFLGMKCRRPVYKPTCASVHSKRVLVKKEVVKEVPEYRWVVEDVCCRCGERIDGTQRPATAPKPATALFGGRVEADEVVLETPPGAVAAEIEQVSAEMPAARSPEAAEGEVFYVADESSRPEKAKATAAPEPERRSWLQRLFGK